MPDRDYYVKAEARFKEAREKYRAHLRASFALAGSDEAAGEGGSRDRRADGDAARARPRSTTSRCAIRSDRSQDGVRAAAEAGARVRLGGLLHRDRVAARARSTWASRSFMKEFDRQLARNRPVADWQTYLEWHVLDSAAPSLSDAVRQGGLRVQRGVPQRRPRDEAALEALRGGDRLAARRGARAEVRREVLSRRRRRRACRSWSKNLRTAMRRDDRGAGLDGPGDEGARAREALARSTRRSATRTSGRTTARSRSRRDAYWESCSRRAASACSDDHGTIGKPVDRGRWGMTPPTSDAYYNPTPERDRLPRRHPAAAGVQHGGRRRDQLRRDRRRHRPRDQPRLRRPGRAVRRAGAAEELVDADGPEEIPGARPSAS